QTATYYSSLPARSTSGPYTLALHDALPIWFFQPGAAGHVQQDAVIGPGVAQGDKQVLAGIGNRAQVLADQRLLAAICLAAAHYPGGQFTGLPTGQMPADEDQASGVQGNRIDRLLPGAVVDAGPLGRGVRLQRVQRGVLPCLGLAGRPFGGRPDVSTPRAQRSQPLGAMLLCGQRQGLLLKVGHSQPSPFSSQP